MPQPAAALAPVDVATRTEDQRLDTDKSISAH